MKATGWLIAAGLAGLLVLQRCGDDKSLARITLQRDSLAQSNDSLLASTREHIRADSIRDAYHAQRLALAEARYKAARGRVDSTLDTLVMVDPQDSMALAYLRRVIDADHAAADSLLAQKDSTILNLRGSLSYWRDTAYAESQAHYTRATELLNASLRVGRPRALGPYVGGEMPVGQPAIGYAGIDYQRNTVNARVLYGTDRQVRLQAGLRF